MYISFAINPIGVEYDLGAWLADLRSGTPPRGPARPQDYLPGPPVRNARSAGFAVPGRVTKAAR